MGYDYALVHLIWTIPPAVLMTAFYWPFFTHYDYYKIGFLVTIAMVSATPWDSYLIRNTIWTYPEDAIVGPTIFKIPMEEIFFFFIQTYNTSLIYSILTKRLVLPCYLGTTATKISEIVGTIVISCGGLYGIAGFWVGGKHTYMSLILGWLCPLMLIPWALSARFILALPRKEIATAIFLPTIYLWIVDGIALQRGTWVIQSDTKLNLAVGALDIEEAVFFLCTNLMIVMALGAVDHGIAIAEYQIAATPRSKRDFPSFSELFMIYLNDRRGPFDQEFLRCVSDAVRTVAKKSQTMYTGSSMFRGQLRIDLILLYSFCRVMDDLVDDAPDAQTSRRAIRQCRIALHRHFTLTFPDNNQPLPPKKKGTATSEVEAIKSIPPVLVTSTGLLPISRLTIDPLLDLLDGFESDLAFTNGTATSPIETESDLELYAYRVAGTVATSVLQLIISHYQPQMSHQDTARIIKAGSIMGEALQYVNIARDIEEDASIGRVYIPGVWLTEEDLTHADILANPRGTAVEDLRERMLCKADSCYRASFDAMNDLPSDVQGPLKTVVNCYMLIGQILRENRLQGKIVHGRLKVPMLRRLRVAWSSMMELHAR